MNGVARVSGVRLALVVACLAALGSCSGSAGDGRPASGATAPAACDPPRSTDPGPAPRTITVGGRAREFIVHLPPNYDGRVPAPLIFNLHGFGGTMKDQDTSTELPEQAGARGYIVVTPQGAPLSVPANTPASGAAAGFEGFAFWNFFGSGGPDRPSAAAGGSSIPIPKLGTDDVAFIDTLLDRMLDEYCVDPHRVFSTGMSNGAGMTTTLGCELGDRLAAIAAVSGVNLSGVCPGHDRLSVLAIHGDADPIAAYTGNSLMGFQLGNPSVPDRMAAWAARDGCDRAPEVDKTTAKLAVARWSGCKQGTDVELWTLVGWGHQWPRARRPSDPGVIDATKVVLDFLDAHGRG